VTGQQVLAFPEHQAGVAAVAYDREGSRLLLAGADGTVQVVDPTTGREVRRLTLDGASRVALSDDGQRLPAFNPDDGTVTVWDTISGRKLSVVRGPRGPLMPVLSPDGSGLIGWTGRSICLWDVQTGEKRFSVPDDAGDPTAAAFRRDGRAFAVASTAAWKPGHP